MINIESTPNLITPPLTISVLLVKGLPSALTHSTVGVGIPAVTRHWNKALPPRITVKVASG